MRYTASYGARADFSDLPIRVFHTCTPTIAMASISVAQALSLYENDQHMHTNQHIMLRENSNLNSCVHVSDACVCVFGGVEYVMVASSAFLVWNFVTIFNFLYVWECVWKNCEPKCRRRWYKYWSHRIQLVTHSFVQDWERASFIFVLFVLIG